MDRWAGDRLLLGRSLLPGRLDSPDPLEQLLQNRAAGEGFTACGAPSLKPRLRRSP